MYQFTLMIGMLQRIKKTRDPRWEEEFQFMLEEPPKNDKLHVEVFSTSKRSRMGLLHPKVFIHYDILGNFFFLKQKLTVISHFSDRKIWVMSL